MAVHVFSGLYAAYLGSGWAIDTLLLGRGPQAREVVGGQVSELVQAGQWWRLLWSVFLHIDLLHLLVNGISLWAVGRVIEPNVQRLQLVAVWFMSGLAGSIVPYLAGIERSDGASGAVHGWLGFALVWAMLHRRQLSLEDQALFGPTLLLALGGNLILGLLLPFVDLSAHIGGLVVGGLWAVLPPGRWQGAAVVALLSGWAVNLWLFWP